MMRVAVLKGGRSLERQVSLRSGARVEDALERLGHSVISIDVGRDLVDRLLRERPDVGVRRAARPRRRGRHRPGAARARRRAVHRLASRRLRPLLGQGRRQAPAARRRHPDARLLRVQRRPRSRSSARPRRCRRSRSGSTSRSSSSRPARAPRWASSSPARRRTSRARSSRRSPTTRRCCSSATSPAATSRSRCSTAPSGPQALPVVEAIPQESDTYDFEARYEIGRTRFVCPAELDDGDHAARAGARAGGLAAARLRRLRARRPDARDGRASCTCSRPTRSPA